MKTRRRFLGALVASVMAIGFLPARAVLGADPETYNVWIGGKQVTSENMGDVLGDGTGSVKYDPETSTLTLDDPALTTSTHESGAQIYAISVDLTIKGNAGIDTGSKYAILVESGKDAENNDIGGSLTIDTENLDVKGEETAIKVQKNISITGKVKTVGGTRYGIYSPQGGVTINGTVNASAPEEAIFTQGSAAGVKVAGGTLISEEGGISAFEGIDLEGGFVDVRNPNSYALSAYGNIRIESGITGVFLEAASDSQVVSSYAGAIEISEDLLIKEPVNGRLDEANKKILNEEGVAVSYAMIVPKKVTVTWKSGIGSGEDIVEVVDYDAEVLYKQMPATWTEPEGMHFDGWYYAEENHYEYCAGGWVEGLLKFHAYGDATMTARYRYWITGWEDTGDNGVYMPFGCIAQERGILKEGGDVHFDAGEHLPIEICLQKGFVLKDNKLEIVSAKSGEVLATVTVVGHDYEKYTCFYTECDMPDEDVTLRFATKNASGITVKYEVTDGADGSWDPESGEDFKLTVHRDPDDENCIYYFESVTMDGTEMVKGVDYTAESGSTKITIKASALASLADGSHDISVNFTDGKAAATFTVGKKTAGSGKTQPVDNSTTNSVNNTGSGAANTSPAPANTPDTNTVTNDTNTTTDGSNNAVNNTPVNNNSSAGNKKNTTTGKIAKTGDTGRTLIPLALVFLAISGGAVVILLVRNRKPKTEYDKLKHIVKRV